MRGALGLWLLLACACLEPGSPTYLKMDTTPPTLVRIDPPLIGPDAGLPVVMAADAITIVFSEEMDPDSLRAGISVRQSSTQLEQPLTIVAAPPARAANDPDFDYPVKISAADGAFPS